MLNAIVECLNSKHGREKSLEKLETILPSMLEGYEERASLQYVQPFMSLNSIREL